MDRLYVPEARDGPGDIKKSDHVFYDDLKHKYMEVEKRFYHESLQGLDPLPVAILDVAKVKVNCERMLYATRRLGLLWRPHVKTHKTVQLTRLQVGDDETTPVSIITSTLAEIRLLMPLMKEYREKGREVNILYSFPIHSTVMRNIRDVQQALGDEALTVMVDHPSQVRLINNHLLDSEKRLNVFIKIDTGYHRAGVLPDSPDCEALISAVLESERTGHCYLHGLYSHASHSYNGQNKPDAMAVLAQEFEGLHRVASKRLSGRAKPLVLSVGATPTATAIQNPGLESATAKDDEETTKLREMMASMKSEGFALEVHAGVYPTLDLQQLATHARDPTLMTHDDIALTILAEVVSLYPQRGANGTTEALITAGSLALGREPVQGGREYGGWGIMSPWRSSMDLAEAEEKGIKLPEYPVPGPDFPRGFKGWEVGRISQEHGILVWRGKKEDEVPLRIGQKIRIWPNHACIAGAGFDHYAVIDGDQQGHSPSTEHTPMTEVVVDVWPRIRGW